VSITEMKPAAASVPAASRNKFIFLVAVCSLMMFLEGVDIQVLGIAAPVLMPQLGIDPGGAGIIFAMTQVGGVLGAFFGGRYSDLWGRRNVLLLSVVLFGAFTFATVLAFDFVSLLVIRTATGFGIGAALPNVIGLAVEAAPERHRVKAVTAVMAGMPVGGASISLLAATMMGSFGWESLFYIGGLLPLVLVPLLLVIPNHRPGANSREAMESGIQPLFKQRRGVTTLLVWAIFFVTAGVVYMMLNWLPILMTTRGLDVTVAQTAAFYFNLASVGGGLVMGYCVDRFGSRLTLPLCYLGFFAGVLGMALTAGLFALMLSVAVVGFFLLGAYYSLSGVVPMLYPAEIRGLAIGAALAVGRIGSILGPLAAGWILQGGGGAAGIVMAMIPAVTLGAAAVSILMLRKA